MTRVAALVLVLLSTSCAGFKESYLASYGHFLDDDTRLAIEAGQIEAGMTTSQVMAAWELGGTNAYRSTTYVYKGNRVAETWLVPGGWRLPVRWVLRFEDGRLASWTRYRQ